MAEKKIITIGRQFGSGGKQIGEALAEKMNIPFYDKELLKEAAKNSGICEEIFDSFDEKPTNSFLYSLVMDPYSLGFGNSTELPLNHKVDRTARIAKKYNISESKAKDMIKKEDKARASYYNYYTSKRWGEMKGYDICINTSKYGIDKTIDLLYDIVNNY